MARLLIAATTRVVAALANPELFFKGPAVASPIEYLGIRFVRMQDRDSPAYARRLYAARRALMRIATSISSASQLFIWQARVSMAIVSFGILSLAALSWWRYRVLRHTTLVLIDPQAADQPA